MVGNYEEGFGKERYKNKWSGPNTKTEVLANGQICLVKEDSNGADDENEKNEVNGSGKISSN